MIIYTNSKNFTFQQKLICTYTHTTVMLQIDTPMLAKNIDV